MNSDQQDWYVRGASGRSNSASVRLSLPGEAADALGIESGDSVVIVVGNESVRLEPVEDFFGQ